RDISHSSAERIILPDATIAIDYMLHRFTNVVRNLTVFPENMKRNIDKTYGVIFSQRVLLTLIDKGMSREDAYGIVQPLAMQARSEEHTSELQSRFDLVCRLLLEKKNVALVS